MDLLRFFQGYLNKFDLVRTERPPAGNRAVSQGAFFSAAFLAALKLNAALGVQWIALFLGILARHYLDYITQNSGAPFWTLRALFVPGIFALMLFPVVFDKAYDKTADPLPVFVKFCSIFAMGVGYQSLIQQGEQASGQGHTP